MEKSYREALAGLNVRQLQAVQKLDGPVLVIAGPGTGKTQLISTRVGHILKTTDTPADAILLLTFTDAGAQAMRDRLAKLIGRPAYDVQINTYHAFGGEIFRQYPDYFESAELTLVEELGVDTILRGIISKLPYSNPLKYADNFIGDLKGFISDSKQALLQPEDIRSIAAANHRTIAYLNRTGRKHFDKLSTISKKSQPVFEDLLNVISAYPAEDMPDTIVPLAQFAQAELQAALDHLENTGKTTQLTEWKRHWLAKDEEGSYVFDGQRLNLRLEAAAGIYRAYQRILQEEHLYDYDDMILRAINSLELNPELKYSLAERYNYIMLDEFQDTNPAQFKLVQLLTDHPVNEGRPNVLAVGDDNQAIYEFQGAEHANMATFVKHYRDVEIISLKENYRSPKELIQVGQNISDQIQSGLQHEFSVMEKRLLADGTQSIKPHIEARLFKSDAAHYEWLANQAKKLLSKGVSPGEIAFLAPKHRYLTPLLPFLAKLDIAVHYERRENILDEPIVRQLERMSQLVLAIADGDETLAGSIWPEVLSYDYWQMPTEKIWRLNWQVRDAHEPWTAQLLNDEEHGYIAAFFIKLASLLPVTSLEQQLDVLIGLPQTSQRLAINDRSPLYDFYFGEESRKQNAGEFTNLIAELSVLRARLESWRRGGSEAPNLRSFIEFTQGHRAAGINILNSSPYHETENSVNLLTAYGAKGREFQAVFIVAANDEVWGSASRNQGYRLALPANLNYIRYQGASEDERLRLLYVAATRARSRLYFTFFEKDLAGKQYSPLKYLDITEADNGGLTVGSLPEQFSIVKEDAAETIAPDSIVNYWEERHLPPYSAGLKEALAPRLKAYKLNQTDLTKFLDIANAGPERFFMQCFLKFPSAPSFSKSYGIAIHNILRFIGRIFIEEGNLPSESRVLEIFNIQLSRTDLPLAEKVNLQERGRLALRRWLAQQGKSLKASDRFEYNFQSEGSVTGEARLNGRIDRLAVDEKTRTITVIDYKIGRAYNRWQPGVIKLHNFRKQLMFYKLLVESSARFKNYQVTKGIIEFVEPDEKGRIQQLEMAYDKDELDNMQKLIGAIWRHIQLLDLPDTSIYSASLAGIRKFEADLISPQKSTGD